MNEQMNDTSDPEDIAAKYDPGGVAAIPPRGFLPTLRHNVSIIVIAGLGLALTLFLFEKNRRELQRKFEDALHNASSDRIAALSHAINQHTMAVGFVERLYAASTDVTREKFHWFVQGTPGQTYPVYRLGWIRRIPHAQREAFEEKARSEGFPAFTLKERGPQGEMVPVSDREEYFPYYFVEPAEPNRALRGFDLASDPARLACLERARDTGEITASDRLSPLRGTRDGFRFLLCSPVFGEHDIGDSSIEVRREALQGFVVCVQDIGELVDAAFEGFTPSGVDFHFFDASGPAEERFLYHHTSRLASPGARSEDETALRRGLHWERKIDVLDRQWIVIATPAPAFFALHGTARHWIFLTSGLLLMGLLTAYLLMLKRSAARERRFAAEQVRVKEELGEKEHYYRSVLYNIHEDILVVGSDYRITDMNNTFLKTTGHSREEVIGQRCFEVTHGYDVPCHELGFECRLRDVFETGEVKSSQQEHRNIDGSMVHVNVLYSPLRDAEGKVTHVIEAVRDITDLWSARAEALSKTLLLEAQSETSLDGILVGDDQGKTILSNSRFVKMWSVPREIMDSGDDRQMIQVILDQIEDPDNFIAKVEYLYDHKNEKSQDDIAFKDGKVFDRYSSPLIDSNGKHYGRIWFFRDITEQKKLETQLRQIQKMEAVGQLAGGVAHDFNNILQVIMGYISFGRRSLPADSPALSDLNVVEQAAKKAARLTQQLLAFSRRQMLKMEAVDLNAVVSGVLKMLRRVIGEDIRLDSVPGDDLATVRADIGQMEQVLMNLCVNARDAMPEGGEIVIETENVVLGDRYCAVHPWIEPGRYVLVSVTDTGCGMDKETQQRIFEPFFTTKELGKGTGLGLATIYGIVKQQEGSIQVYSEVGGGTTFKIYLPTVERSAVAPREKIHSSVVGGTETILVAEDEVAVRNLTVRTLEEAGYTVLAVTDGVDAIELLEERAGEIDLALLDIVMPRKGAKEVVSAIQEIRPELPVLFCSGYSENVVHTRFTQDEDMELLKKPYHPDDLLRKVRVVLDGT